MRVHAILRSFGTPRVLSLMEALGATGAVDSYTVASDAKRDSVNTPGLIKTLALPAPVRALPLEDYGWSKALNAGIRALPPRRDDDELALIVSTEVHVRPEELRLLLKAASTPGASCGYALFAGRAEPTYRLPRNTYIAWRRSVFRETGLFDESLDGDTGMEDYEMVLRSYASTRLLPFAGPRHVRLGPPPGTSLSDKLAWESRGVELIEARHPAWVVSEVRRHIGEQNGD
jgi:hypothetical protein